MLSLKAILALEAQKVNQVYWFTWLVPLSSHFVIANRSSLSLRAEGVAIFGDGAGGEIASSLMPLRSLRVTESEGLRASAHPRKDTWGCQSFFGLAIKGNAVL